MPAADAPDRSTFEPASVSATEWPFSTRRADRVSYCATLSLRFVIVTAQSADATRETPVASPLTTNGPGPVRVSFLFPS